MSTRRRFTAFVAVALTTSLIAGTVVMAASPTRGATYRGKAVRANVTFVVKVARTGRTVNVTLTCGRLRYSLQRLRVRRGRFSGVRNEARARRNPVATITGVFTSTRRVRGTYVANACQRKRRANWTASRTRR